MLPRNSRRRGILTSEWYRCQNEKTGITTDEVLDTLAVFLGEHYFACKGVLGQIKRNMQQGKNFSLNIKNLSQLDVSVVCQFCSRLHNLAFLEEYSYKRSPHYLIFARPTMLPDAQNWFSGQWLERCTLHMLKQVIEEVQTNIGEKIPFQYLNNPQIILPNGDDFEMDIIAFVGNRPLWMEAKSGDYQQHVAKYSKIAKLLNLDTQHAIMVLPDVSHDQCQSISKLFSMTVVNLEKLKKHLLKVLRDEQGLN